MEIPEKLENLGLFAFYKCTSLEKVTIPKSIKTVDMYAFEKCTKLETVVISEGVEILGQSMFGGCTALEDVTIPGSVKETGYATFYQCIGLKSVKILEGTEVIRAGTFFGCESLEKIEIPKSLETIGNDAFLNCISLEKIEIPNSVTTIGINAFNGSNSLKTIYVDKGDTSRVKETLENSGFDIAELNFIEPSTNSSSHRHKHIDLREKEKVQDEYNAKKLGIFEFAEASKGKNAIRIRWEESNNADGYIIYRSTQKNGNFERINKITDKSILEYRDENLEEGTHYYYKIGSYVANTIIGKKVYTKKYIKAKRYTTK